MPSKANIIRTSTTSILKRALQNVLQCSFSILGTALNEIKIKASRGHPAQFDILVCNASFHHYTEPDAVLDEMYRVLKTDGTFDWGSLSERSVPVAGKCVH